MFAAYDETARRLDAWHDGGPVGERPPGRLRRLQEPRAQRADPSRRDGALLVAARPRRPAPAVAAEGRVLTGGFTSSLVKPPLLVRCNTQEVAVSPNQWSSSAGDHRDLDRHAGYGEGGHLAGDATGGDGAWTGRTAWRPARRLPEVVLQRGRVFRVAREGPDDVQPRPERRDVVALVHRPTSTCTPREVASAPRSVTNRDLPIPGSRQRAGTAVPGGRSHRRPARVPGTARRRGRRWCSRSRPAAGELPGGGGIGVAAGRAACSGVLTQHRLLETVGLAEHGGSVAVGVREGRPERVRLVAPDLGDQSLGRNRGPWAASRTESTPRSRRRVSGTASPSTETATAPKAEYLTLTRVMLGGA